MWYLSFEELPVWRTANSLNTELRELIRIARQRGDYRFADQLRGAALSITNNIAEGFERNSPREFIQFLGIAKGSAGEVRSMLYQASQDGLVSEDDLKKLRTLCLSISRQLASFIQHLRKRLP